MLDIKKKIIRDAMKNNINPFFKSQTININTRNDKGLCLTTKVVYKYKNSSSLTGVSVINYEISIFTDLNEDKDEVFKILEESIKELNNGNFNKIIIYDVSYKEYNSKYDTEVIELKQAKNGILVNSEITCNELEYDELEENKKLFKLEIDDFWDSIKIENN